MDSFWLHFLNYFFYGFHTMLIVFNLVGWLFPKTRKLHFYSMLVIVFSWGVLGFWYGFGYCFLTDWHYTILRKLGETQLPNSYIVFLIEKLTGWLPEAKLVDAMTLLLTVIVFMTSVYFNFIRKIK